MDIEAMMQALTLEEKAALVAGTDFMYTNPVPRLDIGSVRMSDGPHGLRVQNAGGDNGVAGSEPATCFPPAATAASSWNPDNSYKIGQAIGKEARHYGIDVVLGPAVNIKRNPLGGRCFEYFSEDPYLSGEMGAAEVQGIQSEGIGVSVKHFALNSSENYRFMGDSVADERAMREIYLKPFEMIVKDAHPETVMCAYNKINGTYCSQNQWLLTDVLRKEWGFDGLVMTDWGATHDRLAMLRAGLDLEMPGDSPICRKWIMDGLESGELEQAVLDKAVRNVLGLIARHEAKKQEQADFALHHALAKDVAIDSAVLLKNNGMFPLFENHPYLIFGELFEKARYQGSGSSLINPAYLSTPKSAFDAHGVKYAYLKGYRENSTEVDEGLIIQAVDAFSQEGHVYDYAVVFAGLTDYVESEGSDRAHMRLPENQLALINALAKLNKRIAIVLYGGSAIELPFADLPQVTDILYMGLPGQNGGEAAYELLYGKANPCGRLAQTWPNSYADVPFGECFGKTANEICKESVFVGYRYYLSADKSVRYPFGYGLSYTSFAYENMTVERTEHGYRIGCDVINTGKRDGAAVVQLYVGAPAVDVFRPKRELKGFSKAYLAAGERKRTYIDLDTDALCYWNVAIGRRVLEDGTYYLEICSDCQTVCMQQAVEIRGEHAPAPYAADVLAIYRRADLAHVSDEVFEKMAGIPIPAVPCRKPIHLESRFSDLKSTLIGKLLYHSVLMVARIDMYKAKRMPEGVERDNKIKGAMMLYNVLDSNSLISMSMCSSGHFSYYMAKGFADLANGKLFKGLKNICTGVKAPGLPKECKNG